MKMALLYESKINTAKLTAIKLNFFGGYETSVKARETTPLYVYAI